MVGFELVDQSSVILRGPDMKTLKASTKTYVIFSHVLSPFLGILLDLAAGLVSLSFSTFMQFKNELLSFKNENSTLIFRVNS